MKSLASVIFLLLAIVLGPLAIVIFLPLGPNPDAQRILIAMMACFGAGATAALLGIVAVIAAHDTIEKAEERIEKEVRSAPTPAPHPN